MKRVTFAAEDSQEPREQNAPIDCSQTAESPYEDDLFSSFLLKEPFREEEIDAVLPSFREALSRPLQLLEKQGFAAYQDFLEKEQRDIEKAIELEKQKRQEALELAKIHGSPRDYQITLTEIAKQRNTIVHLGTGKGKTLIALLCIRHFMALYPDKQTLFLVPSVALAIQHTTTLQANLPYEIETACHTLANSEKAREKLAKARVIVATHGAIHDLLMHYGDMFRMTQFALLVLDECHYATGAGNHMYATILKKWYHTIQNENERPHILGLTASPLLHVKQTHSNEQLENMLSQLEQTLNATIVSFPKNGDERNDDGDQNTSVPNDSSLLEVVVSYRSTVSSQAFRELPSVEEAGMHKSRWKEVRQLEVLCAELGPLITSYYAHILASDVTRNEFENESAEQFRHVVQHLGRIAEICTRRANECPRGGRTDKLLALEELLEERIEEHGSNDTVGLVFVERRITALALHEYFRRRQARIDERKWDRASCVRSKIRAGEDITDEDVSQASSGDQFMDADESPFVSSCHQERDDRRNFSPMKRKKYQEPTDDTDGLGDQFMDANEPGADPINEWYVKYREASVHKRPGRVDDATGEKVSDNIVTIPGQFSDPDDDNTSENVKEQAFGREDRGSAGTTGNTEVALADDTDGLGDQFMDANEPEVGPIHELFVAYREASVHKRPGQVDDATGEQVSGNIVTIHGQFSDPDDDNTSENVEEQASGREDCDSEGTGGSTEVAPADTIRCGVMVRRPTNLFRCTLKAERPSWDEYLQQETKIREVLRALRMKEINVLLATSIAEEGLDVQACSFVIVFDSLKSTKTYIQMKGRARQKDARFYVFQDDSDAQGGTKLSLSVAKKLESRVRDFIARRDVEHSEEVYVKDTASSLPECGGAPDEAEIAALKEGGYVTEHGSVDLMSAKSLLNRYAMSVPLDSSARTSRDSFLLYMPVYEEYRLILPAHLPKDIRTVCLPEQYNEANLTERHNMLALMACVRLHRHELGLLNNRLLPLTRSDLQERLVSVVLQPPRDILAYSPQVSVMFEAKHREVFLFPILVHGTVYSTLQEKLKDNGRSLGLIMLERIPRDRSVAPFTYQHRELGEVLYSLGESRSLKISTEQWGQCMEFHAVLFTSRWRRRTRNEYFQASGSSRVQRVIPRYATISLSPIGQIDWDFMNDVVVRAAQDDEQRTTAVHSVLRWTTVGSPKPRLWTPLYDAMATYVVYGPSTLTCRAMFPEELDGVVTYQNYFRSQKGFVVPESSPLFIAQRLWHLPSQAENHVGERSARCSTNQPPNREVATTVEGERTGDMHDGAPCVLLPQHACMETPVAEPSLVLMTIMLPQFLYHLERTLMAYSFLRHCDANLPRLGQALAQVPTERVLEALTTKSCELRSSYDAMEWLGDAVLKLVQTDAVLQTSELCKWVQCLHEGDLSLLRSVMGSNERLAEVCKRLDIHRFILVTPLARSKWVPTGLELCHSGTKLEPMSTTGNASEAPAMKVCADVMEALLGLVYVTSGYQACYCVARELGIISEPRRPSVRVETVDEAESLSEGWHRRRYQNPKSALTWDSGNCADTRIAEDSSVGSGAGSETGSEALHATPTRQALLKLVNDCLGSPRFNKLHLVEEAFTHGSAVYQDVSSYQRLEWVGDAVLCLAARAWLYKEFPLLEVKELTVMESAIVANETLAFFCVTNGLHKFINHRDQSLPARLENYEWSLREQERGLWGTDPPKVLSDVVEAIVGAAHVGGGFDEGQKATRFLLEPIRTVLKKSFGPSKAQGKLRHPKADFHEIAGNLLRISLMKEDELARSTADASKVWRGNRWCEPQAEGIDVVAMIQCMGTDLIAVAEVSRRTARNRACALAAAMFQKDAELLARLKAARNIVALGLTNEHRETDSSEEDEPIEETR